MTDFHSAAKLVTKIRRGILQRESALFAENLSSQSSWWVLLKMEVFRMWGILPRVFHRVCDYYPDRTAIVDGSRRLTYTDMRLWANRVANGLLSLGVTSGQRVGLLMPNCLEFIPTQYGIWSAGAALVQMPTRASAEDHLYFLKESGATTLIYDSYYDDNVSKIKSELPDIQNLIRLDSNGSPGSIMTYAGAFDAQPEDAPDVHINESDTAYVAFTSGTTGVPKGLVQSHASWTHYSITAGLEIADTRPGEIFAHVTPLTHFTQTFVMPTFMRGGTNVVLPGLDIDTLVDAVARERVTSTALVPTVIYMLLEHPRKNDPALASLQTVVYCGSPMAPHRLRQAIDLYGQIFVQSYAGSEPGYTTCLPKEDHRVTHDEDVKRLASAGRPMYHVDVCIQDDYDNLLPTGEIGEICARQPGQMESYTDPSRNTEAKRDGWVHSGDIGYMDEDSYVYVVDRKKDMIVTGGLNVFPRQIEDILATHSNIAQSAVVGVPDDKWGEAVTAVIVRKSGASISADDVIALVKQRKGSVWAPKAVEFVDELPLNASGKVDKKALRAHYWTGHTRHVG